MKTALGVAATACAVTAGAASSSFPLHLFANNEFLAENDITIDAVRELMHATTAALAPDSNAEATLLVCGPLDGLKGKRQEMIAATGLSPSSVGTFYQSKRDNTGCLSVNTSPAMAHAAGVANAGTVTTVASTTDVNDAWGFVQLPSFLKMQGSVMAYLKCSQSETGCNGGSYSNKLIAGSDNDASTSTTSGTSITSTFSNARDLNVVFKDGLTMQRAKQIIAEGMDELKSSGIILPSWLTMKQQVEAQYGDSTTTSATCGFDGLSVNVLSNGAKIADVHKLSPLCVMKLAELFASSADVLTVSIGTKPVLFNHAMKGQVQSGTPRVEPYSEAGLTGKGQIVAVCDSGIDDLSCFFAEESCAPDAADHSGCLIPRDGTPYPNRRKLIQYTPYADTTDYVAGHGTHVAGTVAGKSIAFDNFENGCESANGIASDAKLILQDIGDEVGGLAGYDNITLYKDILPNAYNGGARIHSNSWGTGALYDTFARDVDKYLYENPDFLVVAAAANFGNIYNQPFIISPSSAKNALTVGASQLRDSYTDRDYQAVDDDNSITGAKGTIAFFSSNGPAAGDRIKPDIVAPGHPVTSARAIGKAAYDDAIDFNKYSPTCSTYPQSGTSMAAPSAAGAAALVRQYFEDEAFWATLCASDYPTCASGPFVPSGYLTKAAMIHSGHPMDRYGAPSETVPIILGETPDMFQGYGHVNLSTILPLPSLQASQNFKLYVHDNLAIAENTTYTWSVIVSNIPAQIAPLKVTISYFDPEDSMVLGTLVHNLDLVVVNPQGVQVWGNKMSGGDELNNNEQVIIATPVCIDEECVYNIFVTGVSISMSDMQKFAIVISTTGIVSEPRLIEGSIPVITPPERNDAVVDTVINDDTMEVYDVQFPDISLTSVDSVVPVTWSMNPSTRVSTVFIEIHNWVRKDVCPVMIALNITAPNGNTYTVAGWPYNFASCFLEPAFTLYQFTSLQGVDLSPLHGDGIWRANVGFQLPAENTTVAINATGPIDIDMSIRFTSVKPAMQFNTFALDRIALTPASNKVIEFALTNLDECTYLAYVDLSLDVIEGNCELADLQLAVTDPTSRVTYFLRSYSFDWNPMAAGNTYNSIEYVSHSKLNGTGIYSLTYSTTCLVNASLQVNMHFANYSQSTCQLYSPSDSYSAIPETRNGTKVEKEITFDVVISSCNVPEPSYVGDAWCDNTGNYNTASCAYDGGDCCIESCVDTVDMRCGSNNFYCVDPLYAETDGARRLTTVGNTTLKYAGSSQIAEFLMEGTLESMTVHIDSSVFSMDTLGARLAVAVTDPNGHVAQIGGADEMYLDSNIYNSLLPIEWTYTNSHFLDASRDMSFMGLYSDKIETVSGDTTNCAANISSIGNGFCDADANNKDCNYDGGDCCEKSCVSGQENACGSNGYDCVDSRYKFWTVTIFIGSTKTYYPEVHYRGSVTMRYFNETVEETASPTSTPTSSPTAGASASPSATPSTSPTSITESQAPSATPTAEPSKTPTVAPTASPTAIPTRLPTASGAENIYISYDVFLALETVECNGLIGDSKGHESVRRTTRDVLQVGDTEVEYDDTDCNAIYGNKLYPTVSDVSMDVNIYKLGYSDPTAAYMELNRRLQESIDSGVYLAKLRDYADLLASPSLQTVTNVTLVQATGYEVETAGSDNEDLSSGAVAGIVIGVLVGVGVAACVVYYMLIAPNGYKSSSNKEERTSLGAKLISPSFQSDQNNDSLFGTSDSMAVQSPLNSFGVKQNLREL